jgi:hypothetical protein
MSFDAIVSGSVIRYPYLWGREADRGESGGRKGRPTVVGVRIAREGGDWLLLFPITTKAPQPGQWAVPIPEIEKKRAGLSLDRDQWIVLDEANQDVVGRSYHLSPDPRIGSFSRAFFGPIAKEVVVRWREVRRVSRR